MNRLLDIVLSRPRPVLATLLFLLVAGSIAYVEIPKEAEPELDIPVLVVNLVLEGVTPVDAERLLVRPLEERFADLEGLKKIQARAFRGGATLSVEFDGGTDLDVMQQEVRNRIDMAWPQMPADMKEPQISEVRPSLFPMMVVVLSGDLPERTLLYYGRRVRDEIRTLPGVFDAKLTGLREELAEVIIDPARIQSYGLSADEVTRTFARANRLVPAGNLDTGQGSFTISVPGLFESVQDILNLPVKAQRNAVVRLGEIASVRRTFKDAETTVTLNGRRAAAIEVVKTYGANIIDTSDDVLRNVEAARRALPDSVFVDVVWDSSRNVKAQFFTLQNSVILAVFLVMAIVIGALGLRSGLLVGISIPGSFLSGILVLYLFGVTISFPVMFGLIIAVGILVDGAIVVTEYADRKLYEGVARRRAYTLAAQRMAWPIISSTATTVAAFVPLLFWPGIPGQMFFYLPVTLICILSSSLLMALVFVPTIGAIFGPPGGLAEGPAAGDDDDAGGPAGALTRLYGRVLQVALAHPGKVMAGTVALLIVSIALYGAAGTGLRFTPKQEPRRAMIVVEAPGNLAIEEKAILIGEVERRISDIGDIDNIYTRIGAPAVGSTPSQIGEISLHLKEWEDRRPGEEVLRDVRERTRDIPGLHTPVREQQMGAVQGKPIAIELSGDNPAVLARAVVRLVSAMQGLGGFASIEDSRPVPGIEWRMEVNRTQAARFGADVTAVGNAVRLVTNGLKLGTYRPDDSEDEVDVVVRYPEEYRNIAELDELTVQTNQGPVPISNFVQRRPVPQETEILRIDGRRVMTVESDVEPGVLADNQVRRLKDWLETNPLSGVDVRFRGEDEQQQQSGSFLIVAFALALFLMAAILLVQFNSFYSVLLILSSVVLSTIGVFFGYAVSGLPFILVMSGIGIIALAGIVVNNNIVLIDTYDRLIKTAPGPHDAIMQTGMQRLRPVFLTTATTALGLLPMAAALSIDFVERRIEWGVPATVWWQQLAATIVFGLTFATVLTLVVTPAALMLKSRRRASRFVRPIPASDTGETIEPPLPTRSAAE